MSKWEHNPTQFARLLDEIRCMGLTPQQYEQLKKSMDLEYEDIDELFERAALEFHRSKTGRFVRDTTPQDELDEWVDGSAI